MNAAPTPSKRLIVPAPKKKSHLPKKVYSDCRHRLMVRQEERGRSSIRIEAWLNDSQMRVLSEKLPIQQVQGLEATGDSNPEYILYGTPKTKYRSATRNRQ
ncbi:hypothetical protein L3X38_011879 [Prunus dulcis]|uniref:Uncharacterized protein n=1 Tax=Prunus dulcis TaxID=3755 RepID=A0AAD4ZEQ4_PRUDU|nr:hypothetical protein L3X38_011879 [Prunus dulcis]